ncbi:hypothetical protein F4781DRAFT_433735 [Annulohypoxylon bovei var. microspora]|nr:hypothetical protein F4781DRAFT_433735 [Annulohypoxylon bovei var. microspora]
MDLSEEPRIWSDAAVGMIAKWLTLVASPATNRALSVAIRWSVAHNDLGRRMKSFTCSPSYAQKGSAEAAATTVTMTGHLIQGVRIIAGPDSESGGTDVISIGSIPGDRLEQLHGSASEGNPSITCQHRSEEAANGNITGSIDLNLAVPNGLRKFPIPEFLMR